MNKKSRVYVSGANGNLGSEIVKRLRVTSNTEVIALKRDSRNSYIENLLLYENDSFIGEKTFIHCGWNVANRSIEAQKRSMIDTELLANLCNLRNITMIFLSSASASETSTSNYGKMKYIAQNCVIKSGGLVLQPGLIIFDQPQGIQKSLCAIQKRFVAAKFYPNVKILTIGINSFYEEIEFILINRSFSNETGIIKNKNSNLNDLCAHLGDRKKITILIPLRLIEVVLRILGKVNHRADSLHDSLVAIYP